LQLAWFLRSQIHRFAAHGSHRVRSQKSEAAALFFALISSRYERRSLVLSSNKTLSAWAKIFGDPVAVAAMVDPLVHHAEIIVLKGDSYRLKGKGKEVLGSGSAR
jgi:DNA replication protein DnaC